MYIYIFIYLFIYLFHCLFIYNTRPDDGTNDRNSLLIWKYAVSSDGILTIYWTHVIYANFCLPCLWSRRTLSTSLANHVRFLLNQVTLRQMFIWLIRFFPCRYDSTNVPYSSSPKCWCCQKNKTKSLGAFRKEWSFENRGALDRKILSLT